MERVTGRIVSFTMYDEEPLKNVPTTILSETTKEVFTYILGRSGDVPLNVSLHFPTKYPELDDVVSSVWRPFFSLLSAEAPRWRSLNLVAPAPIWGDFAAIPQDRLKLLEKVHATIPRTLCLMPVLNRC